MPLGEVETSRKVSGEVREIEVWFVPAPHTEINAQVLGLLGRFAATPCLIEPFRNAATPMEIRSCLSKLFDWREEAIEQGIQQGIQSERRTLLENLLRFRFGSLDDELSAIIEPWVGLPIEEFTSLVLQLSQLSREDLLARFSEQNL